MKFIREAKQSFLFNSLGTWQRRHNVKKFVYETSQLSFPIRRMKADNLQKRFSFDLQSQKLFYKKKWKKLWFSSNIRSRFCKKNQKLERNEKMSEQLNFESRNSVK